MTSYVGIDYSLTSPAVAVFTGDTWSIKDCKIYYFTDTKKYLKTFYDFQQVSEFSQNYKSQQERFFILTSWVLDIIKPLKKPIIGIEGYSYASTGQVFDIAENGGLLKHYLWQQKQNFNIIAPTQIKKFATSNGRANKRQMYDAFVQDTNLDFALQYEKCNVEKSPVSDIVDAYFICKYIFTNKKNS